MQCTLRKMLLSILQRDEIPEAIRVLQRAGIRVFMVRLPFLVDSCHEISL